MRQAHLHHVLAACLLPAWTVPAAEQDARPLARVILETAGTRGGLIVHLGCGDGKLTAALGAGGNYLVHGLDTSMEAVDTARRTIRGLGRYGPVSVARLRGPQLPYADNLVNLLVVSHQWSVVSVPPGRWPDRSGRETSNIERPTSNVERKRRLPTSTLDVERSVFDVRVSHASGQGALEPRRHTLSRAEAMRVLCPGGVAVRVGDKDAPGPTVRFRKPWPDDIDEWTHFLHGPDSNPVARDTVVGPPARVQWTAGPKWSRDHDTTPSVFALVSAGGRLFYVQEQGPVCVIDKRLPEQYSIVARDAFNGVLLWKRPMPEWYSSRVIWGHMPVHSQRRLVAVADRVYTTLGIQAPLTALDAATGDTIREYAGTECTSEVVCDQGVLALVIRKEEAAAGLHAGRDGTRFRRGYTGPEGGGETLMGVEAETGERLWCQERSCVPLTLALSGGRAFFVEDKHIVCLNAADGRQIWKAPFPARTLVLHSDKVLAATDRNTAAYDRASKNVQLVALSAADGTRLWAASGDCLPNFNFFYAPVDLYVARGQVWGLAEELEWNKKPGTGSLLGLDLATGQTRTRISLSGAFTPGHHVRCYKGKATEKYLLFNKRGIEFVNIQSGGEAVQQQWVRGACRYGILPCNGLVYAPTHACACYPGAKLDGFHALAAQASAAAPPAPATPPAEQARLERGPEYGLRYLPQRQREPRDPVSGSPLDPRPPGAPEPREGGSTPLARPEAAWPTYRHDPARSGVTPTLVRPNLRPLWQADLKGRLSAPVAAAGRLFVAGTDEHTVYCLNADDGRVLWSFTAEARVDSPPTVHEGLVLFGARDGRCTCLAIEDGSLVWSFLAAPSEHLVAASGQLESAWPLHGSVLVKNDTAYIVAGRSSFLDGGMHIYGLDVGSGFVRYRTDVSGPDPGDPTVAKTAGRMPGAVPDILTSDGQSLFMRHLRLSPDLSDTLDAAALTWGSKGDRHLLAGSGFLDDTLFNRSVWQIGPRIDRSQMLVVDGAHVYGLRVYEGISWNCSVFNPGDGYLLFRQDVGKPAPKPPPKERKRLNRIPYERYDWHTRVPARVCAMVLTGAAGGQQNTDADAVKAAERRLFVAGVPDQIDPDDPLAAFEGRSGARLLALSASDGKRLAEHELEVPPVWDGMIAYRNRLYLAMRNGKVLCLDSAE